MASRWTIRWPGRSTLVWMAVGAAFPAASAAALVQVRGSVSNTDIALLILSTVLLVATSRRLPAVVVAAASAALSYDYFHTLPYHSFTIANGNDRVATLVLGLLGLMIGLVATRAARAYEELVLIVAVAALSQAVPQPARLLVNHSALDVCLGVLVFVTALTIPPSALTRLGAQTRRIGTAILAGTLVLPALAWAVSQLVSVTALRRGVLVVGLAPAEIASVATVSLAGGDATVAACLLVVSTMVTVGVAGVALRLLGGAAHIDALALLGHLALIVAVPMLVGLVVRARLPRMVRWEDTLARLSIAIVLLLVWLIASQIHLSDSYLSVAGALVLFLAGSAALGVAVGWRASPPVAVALLLSTSMRDFAIAAGIAVAAFGAGSSAPLGLYGVLVILWGMLVAARRRPEPLPGAADRAASSPALDAPASRGEAREAYPAPRPGRGGGAQSGRSPLAT